MNSNDLWIKLNKATRKASKYPTKRNISKAKLAEIVYMKSQNG